MTTKKITTKTTSMRTTTTRTTIRRTTTKRTTTMLTTTINTMTATATGSDMPSALGLVSLLIFRFIVIIVELSGHSWQRLLSFANTGKQVSKKVNITEFQKN